MDRLLTTPLMAVLPRRIIPPLRAAIPWLKLTFREGSDILLLQ